MKPGTIRGVFVTIPTGIAIVSGIFKRFRNA